MKSSYLSEKGAIIPILVLILLLIGLVVSLQVIKVPQIFKPKAANNTVEVLDKDGNIPKEQDGEIPVVNSEDIKLKLDIP